MASTSKIPPAELLYLKQHVHDSLAPNLIACIVICGVLAYVAVALRFLSRRIGRSGYGADDWMIATALFLYTFYLGLTGAAVHYGLGRHVNAVPSSSIYSFALTSLISTSVYGLAIMAIKLAILLLYLRLFSVGPSRPFIYASGGLVVAVAIMNFFGNIFKCVPVSASLNASPRATATCINYLAFAGTMQGLNIVTDLIVLLIPVPTVWRLKMERKKKLMVIGTLAMGSAAVVISIVRLAIGLATVISVDLTWIEVPPITASLVEICIGIVAGCLPTYRPLLAYLGLDSKEAVGKGAVAIRTPESGNSKLVNDNRGTEKSSQLAKDGQRTGIPMTEASFDSLESGTMGSSTETEKSGERFTKFPIESDENMNMI